jgi:Transposase DDE domain
MLFHLNAALRRIQEDLAKVLQPEQIATACRDVGHKYRERVLDPITTIHLFVTQILHGNFAVARLREFADEAFSEAAYCKARGRLPLALLQKLLERVGSALRPIIDDDARWHGHRTFHVDGSSFSMPDTEALQEEFGQPGRQRPGCGFPVAHMLALFHAGTGFIKKVLTAPLRSHDMAQTALVHPELDEGDILIGDRAFCSFVHLAVLAGRRRHGVFRAHQKQIVDFTPHRPFIRSGKKGRRGTKNVPTSRWLKRLGKNDQLVEYFKPKKGPDWMSEKDFAALPDSLVVRELKYSIHSTGSRTREVCLVTTLLDADLYPKSELADLYGSRWCVETNLRHLKQTMKMEVLHCETVEGIKKELTVFALVYNLVRAVMYKASQRQQVDVERISFADALG